MSEQMYSVRVMDYGLPSFCSGDNHYYGTEQSIMTLLEKNYEDGSDILQAVKDYFSGKGSGAASLFGEAPQSLIEPVEVVGTSSCTRDNVSFKFFNIYRWPTDITIKHLTAQLVYIVDSDERLKRCVKATISGATYIDILGNTALFAEDDWMCWGLPGMIEIKGTTMHNTLFYADTTFENIHKARKDIEHPHKPYLRDFFFEIYGDG